MAPSPPHQHMTCGHHPAARPPPPCTSTSPHPSHLQTPHHLRQAEHASFVRPDERAVAGSAAAFKALLDAMVRADAVAVCAYRRGCGSDARLVAMLPQLEARDALRVQVRGCCGGEGALAGASFVYVRHYYCYSSCYYCFFYCHCTVTATATATVAVETFTVTINVNVNVTVTATVIVTSVTVTVTVITVYVNVTVTTVAVTVMVTFTVTVTVSVTIALAFPLAHKLSATHTCMHIHPSISSIS
eukprot:351138-Chlamydomonas_euryale.AAC.1